MQIVNQLQALFDDQQSAGTLTSKCILALAHSRRKVAFGAFYDRFYSLITLKSRQEAREHRSNGFLSICSAGSIGVLLALHKEVSFRNSIELY